MFEQKIICSAHSVLGLGKELWTSSVSSLSDCPCAELAGTPGISVTPPLQGLSLPFVPGGDTEHPSPVPAEPLVCAAEPTNNPLEISGHFMCLKLSLCLNLSLCLSTSRTQAGELGTHG